MQSSRRKSGRYGPNEIFETLAHRIMRWEIPAGERLTEETLSAEFGVSRTPVREALRLLEHSGHVDRSSGRSYVVRRLSLADIDDIYTVRVALEELAVELAATAVRSDAFRELQRVTLQAVGDPNRPLREAFHEELAVLGGNRELHRMLGQMNQKIFACRRLDAVVPEREEAARHEHLEILRLLDEGRTAEACKVMRSHIEQSRSTVRSLMRAGITTISFGAAPKIDLEVARGPDSQESLRDRVGGDALKP
jgi:DNA-binding GntR family transcriptional regulator